MMTTVAGLAVVTGAGIVIRIALGLDELYWLRATASFAVVMLVATAYVSPGHPFAVFGPANLTTAIRAMLTALLTGFIGEPGTVATASLATAIAVVAIVLDGVDGWLARRTGLASAFGARFDMEVDALLILILAGLTFEHGNAGAWVLASGLLRYLFVAAAWPWPWMAADLPPSLRRKTVCVVQIAALIITVSPLVTPPSSEAIAALALAILAWSFAVDVAWLWRHARVATVRSQRRHV